MYRFLGLLIAFNGSGQAVFSCVGRGLRRHLSHLFKRERDVSLSRRRSQLDTGDTDNLWRGFLQFKITRWVRRNGLSGSEIPPRSSRSGTETTARVARRLRKLQPRRLEHRRNQQLVVAAQVLDLQDKTGN
jgi:hypothetical protein